VLHDGHTRGTELEWELDGDQPTCTGSSGLIAVGPAPKGKIKEAGKEGKIPCPGGTCIHRAAGLCRGTAEVQDVDER